MLWAALGYSAGIVAGAYLWRPVLWWLVAGAGLTASVTFYVHRRPRAAFTLGLSIFFVAGALSIQLRPAHPANLDILQFADGRDAVVSGYVLREDIRPGEHGSAQRLDIETEAVTTTGKTFAIRSGLRLNLYRASSFSEGGQENTPGDLTQSFFYGQRLRFPAKLQAPRNFQNPGAFDYRGYLAEKGLAAIASTKLASVQVLPGFSGSRFEFWRARVFRSIEGKIHQLWAPPQAALIDAVLMGQESFLDNALETDFQRTGTYHVLVVSGLKVGILAVTMLWLFRVLRVGDFLASAATIFIVLAYAVLTDVGVPVWRAALMLAIYLISRLVFRQRSAMNTIGAAALALLIIDPAALLSASFQLSFLCVLIIAGIIAPMLERSTQPVARALRNLKVQGYDFALSPRLVQLRLDLRMIAGRLQRFRGGKFSLPALAAMGRMLVLACEFILISAVLQAAFALPMAYYFHRATYLSLPANVLVVPLTQLIMIAGAVAIGMSYLAIIVAKLPATIAGVAVTLTYGSVRWFGSLRMADARVPTPSVFAIAFATIALVAAMLVARRGRWLAGWGMAAIVTSSLWICAVPPNPSVKAGVLEITSIDVGQGDSILVVTPQGRTMLIDAGGLPHWMHSDLDIGEDVVSPYLWWRGFSHLDIVALTHAHADHMGGMPAVLENFHPRELWLGVDSAAAELQPLLRTAQRLGIPVFEHRTGDASALGGAQVRVLAPARDLDVASSKPNDESLVMKISFGATSALLEGEAEKKTEKQVAEESPQADLLKVGHHGSNTSTIPELLAAVHPGYAVISVGARNVYGHPRIEVLGRLAAAKVLTYRTDVDGATTFYLDGNRVTPRLAAPR